MSQSPIFLPRQAVQPALADVSNQHVSRSAEAGPKAPAHTAHEELVQVQALERKLCSSTRTSVRCGSICTCCAAGCRCLTPAAGDISITQC